METNQMEAKSAVESSRPPQNWKRPATTDEIIDAYEAGKSEQSRINIDALNRRLKKACNNAEKLLKKLVTEADLKCSGLHMRILGISRFEALFLIDLESYLDKQKRSMAYSLAKELSKTTKTDTFHIEFTFMPFKNEVNQEAILTEGFFLTYNPDVKKTRTRKT